MGDLVLLHSRRVKGPQGPGEVRLSGQWSKLFCPLCELEGWPSNLHHGEAIVRTRCGEDGPGVECVVASPEHAKRKRIGPDGFLGRRNDIEIRFACEAGHELTLQIMQHKGDTLLRWAHTD